MAGVRRSIDVLHCDDLILFKLLAGHLIDRADAAMLLRENRDAIELDYLLTWFVHLKLTEEFAECWCEAFPNEEPPATTATQASQ